MKLIEGLPEAMPRDCVTLTVRQVAGALHIAEDAVRAYIKQGLIDAMYLGERQTRIPASSLARFIRQQTVHLSAYEHVEAA
jgi:excisionase family DNA binding protein